jgi:hypothetical protein
MTTPNDAAVDTTRMHADSADYIGRMATELAEMARAYGHGTIEYLLEMTALEAQKVAPATNGVQVVRRQRRQGAAPGIRARSLTNGRRAKPHLLLEERA